MPVSALCLICCAVLCVSVRCACSPYAEGAESHPQYGELEDVQISNPTQRAKAAGAGSSQPHSAMDIDDEQPGAARAAAASAKKQAASAASSASSSAAAAASSSAPGMLAGKIAAPIFELAWNGRLIPESTCHTLDWIQAACKGRLAPCRFRLKGQSAAAADNAN